MTSESKKTMWIVGAIVAFIIAFGIGVMCSGDSPHIITLPSKDTTKVVDSAAADSVVADTIVVDSTK